MKPTTPPLPTTGALAPAATWADWLELTKPRLSLLSVITALVGYLAALPERHLGVLVGLLAGTSLAAAGAAALNMWQERELDARMARTRERPLPAGRLQPGEVLAFGLALCLLGDLLLWFAVHPLSALLALATQVTYLLAYTPLKTRSPWCTHLGALPGALPPLIGWAAAEGSLGTLGWVLFGILFAWQIPHFMAIAWMHRKDYAEAGMPMLTVTEPTGRAAAWHSLLFTLALVVVSLVPVILGQSGWVYGAAALLLGGWFLWKAILFCRADAREATAKPLFLASIAYLPALLAVLVIDRWL